MELCVTALVRQFADGALDPSNYSCSQAEAGAYAGANSWRAAVRAGHELGPLTPETLAAARDHFLSYGAWDEDEVASWTEAEIRGMLMQEVAADWRESWGVEEDDNGLDLTDADDFAEATSNVRERSEAGSIGGRLYSTEAETADAADWYI